MVAAGFVWVRGKSRLGARARCLSVSSRPEPWLQLPPPGLAAASGLFVAICSP